MLAFSAGVWYYITMEKQKKWYNPLILATVCILVGIVAPALIINHTVNLSYDMQILIRVPTFMCGTALLLVAGAALSELSIRVRE